MVDAAPVSVVVDAEFAALIPPLTGDELTLLEASLVRDGCREPLHVWADTGILLDGHNRYEVCRRHGVKFEVREVAVADRDEALLWVIENQLGRRNLADIDRIALAARREPMLKARVARKQGARPDLPQNSAEGPEPAETRLLAAASAGVSHDTYTKGKKVLEHGAPELVQAVRDGDASIHAAAAIADLPAEDQVEVVANGKVTETAKKLRNRRQQNTSNSEWGTPRNYVDAVRQVLRTIDVDPATHTGAQERIQATTFYTAEDDGLSKDWRGTVFLNPPCAKTLMRRFVQKLVDDYVAGKVTAAVLITNNQTDESWFQSALAHASRVCFPRERIRFLRADGRPARNGPLQGQAVFYFGDDGAKFTEVFSPFGAIVTPTRAALEV